MRRPILPTLNPLCWIFGHLGYGCLCDGGRCENPSTCPAQHCRRSFCIAPLTPLPKMRIVR